MIKVPTTLVLGAGSSVPYGLPTGLQLRRMICDQFRYPEHLTFVQVQELGHSQGEITAFREAFYRSQINSIDLFLANNKDFWEVGKAAIAAVLIQLERESNLLEDRNGDNWYRYLWNLMERSWDGFTANNLRIITFNYDRSLEMFLAVALTSFHQGKGLDAGLDKVNALRIVHVYGTLGKLGPEGRDSRPYQSELSPDRLRVAASSIRVIPEHRDNEREQELIRQWITESSRICYLGFSYDPINLERLNLGTSMPDRGPISRDHDVRTGESFEHGKDVLGTVVGLRSAEVVLAAAGVRGFQRRFRDLQCEDFLREYGVLL